ncbi:DUF1987 domain-containing protein [Eisenibacter elegans]|uniref:DUF1987 domain-containing protein n=1 Tax=Eisenibacter elegans TaxID=997 RepID=UPI0004241EF0|nr:DUF1987 domain-containing protein [Eisenibacter elegans]
MENLYLEGTKGVFFTPTVAFDATHWICEISGESYIEDTEAFYEPLYQWITQMMEAGPKRVLFNFRLTYFNTSTSKAILQILQLLKGFRENGGNIEINWYYPEDNYDLLVEGEDFVDDLELNINLIPYQLEY